jgi:hypothetical protein
MLLSMVSSVDAGRMDDNVQSAELPPMNKMYAESSLKYICQLNSQDLAMKYSLNTLQKMEARVGISYRICIECSRAYGGFQDRTAAQREEIMTRKALKVIRSAIGWNAVD